MERIGISEALNDATDAVFANLRRSAIPDEYVQFLSRAGIANPELEITIMIEYARRNIGISRGPLLQELRNTDLNRQMADRLERAPKEFVNSRPLRSRRRSANSRTESERFLEGRSRERETYFSWLERSLHLIRPQGMARLRLPHLLWPGFYRVQVTCAVSEAFPSPDGLGRHLTRPAR